jgi:hypothetical protein
VEKPSYTRIIGALPNLGYNLAGGTMANILKRNGIEPARERSRKIRWKDFLAGWSNNAKPLKTR